MTDTELLDAILEKSLEFKRTLRDWLTDRIRLEAAEAEWARQQACPHPRGRVERSGNWSDFYCPDCHMRVNESEYRSRGAK